MYARNVSLYHCFWYPIRCSSFESSNKHRVTVSALQKSFWFTYRLSFISVASGMTRNSSISQSSSLYLGLLVGRADAKV